MQENYFIQQHTASRAVYFLLLLLLIIFLGLLPIIKVDITTQSNGIIRSGLEDNVLQSAVYGDIILARITENGDVQKGDTLVVISTRKADEQINHYKFQFREDSIQVHDLISLLGGQTTYLSSDLYREGLFRFSGETTRTEG